MIFLDTCILIDYSKDKIVLDFKNNYCISSIVKLEFKVGAFIAATCLVYDLPLWTHNKKDFQYIDGMELK